MCKHKIVRAERENRELTLNIIQQNLNISEERWKFELQMDFVDMQFVLSCLVRMMMMFGWWRECNFHTRKYIRIYKSDDGFFAAYLLMNILSSLDISDRTLESYVEKLRDFELLFELHT